MSASDNNTAVILPPAPGEALVPLRYRFDGWTAGKQRLFLAALGDLGCIRDACKRVGMSKTSAYRLRERSAEFAAAWDAALDRAATVLEQVAYDRAVTGVEEPVWYYGKQVGTRRRFSDGLLRMLVLRGDLAQGRDKTRGELVQAAHDAARAAGGYFSNNDGREEAFASIAWKLDRMASHRRRLEADQAEKWLAEGKIP
jgi:hypothetical protein